MEIFFLLWCRFAVNGDCFYCGADAVVKSLQRKPILKEEFEDEEEINLKKESWNSSQQSLINVFF